MRLIGHLLLPLLLASAATAQGPRLVAREENGNPATLAVTRTAVTVRMLADVAETELEMEVSNPTGRQLEAEFILPLRPGTVVTGYALDVQGSLREAVAVEKELARNAYETIKRRRIDPGIVEREADHHRIRVYPVMPNGKRTFRVRYTETLPPTKDGFSYTVPLVFGSQPENFSCHLYFPESQKPVFPSPPGLAFADKSPVEMTVEVANKPLPETLALVVPAPREPTLFTDTRSGAFLLSLPAPPNPLPARPAPASLALVWDASLAGLGRDPAPTLALLDRWFAGFKQTEVMLYFLRDRRTEAGRFTIRDGRWPELRKVLATVEYDGMADLSALPPATNHQPMVFVSHGTPLTTGIASPPDGPLLVIQTGTSDAFLTALATISGGVAVNPAPDPGTAVAALQRTAECVLAVSGWTVSTAIPADHTRSGFILPWQPPQAGAPQQIFGYGRLTEQAVAVRLQGAAGARTLNIRPTRAPDGLLERLAACQRLRLLEAESPVSPDRIIAHCKQHQLASSLTSLLVLERIEDYVDHRIEPPAGQLRDDYEKRVPSPDRGFRQLVGAWARKVADHTRDHPGVAQPLMDRLRQIDIWKRAMESLFQPAQRDAAAFNRISGWLETTRNTIGRKPALKTKADFTTWQHELRDLTAQGEQLAETPLAAPRPDQPLAVSVRGAVNQPGVHTGSAGLTLRKAIDMAGGPSPVGSLDTVALYRNGGMVLYNTLSRAYQDVPLFPGDMIVVMPPLPDEDSTAGYDGFSSQPPPAPPDPGSAPPVREKRDLWVADASGELPPAPGLPSRPAPRLQECGPAGDLTKFERDLAGGMAPAAAYRAFTGDRRQPPGAYVEAARRLFAHHQPELARRVLSNLVAVRPRDREALFSHALWLAEFGQSADAVAVMRRARGTAADAVVPCLTLASLHSAANDPKAAAAVLDELPRLLEPLPDPTPGTIALTDYTARRLLDKNAPALPPTWSAPSLSRILYADLRIVLLSAEGEPMVCQVAEPPGTTAVATDRPTLCGGLLSTGAGVAEYLIRQAIPGRYVFTCSVDRPTTVRVAVHTHWGSPKQQTQITTRWLEPGTTHVIVDHEFVPES